MDDPALLKLPESNVEGCEDPKSVIWAQSNENQVFYSHLSHLLKRFFLFSSKDFMLAQKTSG